jgi:hypothetical protein
MAVVRPFSQFYHRFCHCNHAAVIAAGSAFQVCEHIIRSINLVVNFFTVRMLREELQLLQESGSYVGEVVKAMDKKKVLVKVRAFCLSVFFKLVKNK